MRISRLFLLTAIAALPASAQAITSSYFGDTHFFDFETNYTTQIYAPPGYTTSFGVVSQSGGAFNRVVDFTYERIGENPNGVRFQAFNETFVYDPSLQGIISTIDFSIGQLSGITSEGQVLDLTTRQMNSRLLARQGGLVYEAARLGPNFARGSYVTDYWQGLVASDFTLFDPANPNAPRTLTGLDFAGGAITFGFELTPLGTIRTSGAPITGLTRATLRADDFNIAIHALDPVPPGGVPEPGQWLLMIAGFGIVGAAARTKSRRTAVS